MKSAKVGFVSLGCPKNAIDCERMFARVHRAGYEITAEETEADVVIVNTCAFIQSAKEEAIETILDLNYLKENHNLKAIIVTGCLAQRYYEEILKELPEVDSVLALGAESDVVAAIETVLEGGRFDRHGAPEELCIEGDRVLIGTEKSAYLKIAEGCDNRCTYCAIPLIRGAFRSRKMEDILAEAQDLYELGVRELILCAQDTTRYGLDLYGEYKLAQLLEKLCTSTAFRFTWIRLMYCYPDKITDDLIRVMQTYDCVAKYIDLPIQHASDSVLSAMNRHGNSAEIASAVRRLRQAMPDIVIRTTVMVGFPGETDADYAALRAFLSEMKFERLGAFAFSAEEGTAAAEMFAQIPDDIKQRRLDNLMESQYTIHIKCNEKYIGKTLPVLVEAYDPVARCYSGRSQYLAPEVDGYIYITSEEKLSPGDFVRVRVTEIMDYDLLAEVVS